MAENDYNEDEEEKLHNSSDTSNTSDFGAEYTSDDEAELVALPFSDADTVAEESQEQIDTSLFAVDLGDQCIYYYRDADGELHRREFLAEELAFSAQDFSDDELRKAEQMNRTEADMDIVNVVRTPEEAEIFYSKKCRDRETFFNNVAATGDHCPRQVTALVESSGSLKRAVVIIVFDRQDNRVSNNSRKLRSRQNPRLVSDFE